MRILKLLVLLTLMSSAVYSQTIDSESARKIREIRKAIAVATDDCDKASRHWTIAQFYRQNQMFKEAIDDYLSTIKYATGKTCVDADEEEFEEEDEVEGFPFVRMAQDHIAESYVALKDWPRAITWFGKVIALNPHSDYYHQRGHAYLSNDNLPLAIQDFTTAIEKRSASHLYTDRGYVYWKQKEYDLSIADNTKAIELDPKSARGYYMRAVNRYQHDKKPDLALAIADLSKAIEINPKHADALADRGWLYMRQGRNDLALPDLNASIVLAPAGINSLYNRGVVYFNTSDWERALADFTKTIELNHSHADALRGRGEVYLKLNKPEAALADLNKSLEINPAGFNLRNASHFRGVALSMLGRYPEAEIDLSKAIRLGYEFPNGYYSRGVVYFRMSKFDLAIADFEKAVALGAKPETVATYKARIFFVQDKFVQALAEVNSALKTESSTENFELRASIYCSTGKKLLAKADERKVAALGGTVSQPCQ
ncbi:MAG: hypothetical protein DMF63_06260 [Acidobacteria bacterium]|nr:MAG: hypothetical protein DMF63_06260 [Acidobacteriota bacterium]